MAPAPVIAFSHANGFPAATYRQHFDAWRAAGYRVISVDRYGHDPAYPVSNNWPSLREQLTDFIHQEAPGERVHLVGHSLGGFLSLLAACKRPDLALGVVLLDSPVLTGWKAHSVKVAKAGRLIHRFSPGRVSARRRWQWPSAEAALAHFQSKHNFARWEPSVLQDYITAGTEPDPAGSTPQAVRLAFNREIETRIYNTLADNLGRELHAHPPQCPISYLAGTRSIEGRQVGLAATKALTHGRLRWIEGSHLFPMEKPAETAQAVLDALAEQQRLAAA